MPSIKAIEAISNDVRKYILENYLFGFSESDLNNNSSFLEMGVLDSTGIMELVSFIEKDYGFQVQDSEILPDNLDSVDCISNYIYSKLSSIAEE